MDQALFDAFLFGLVAGFLLFPLFAALLVSIGLSIANKSPLKEQPEIPISYKVWGFEDHPQATYSVDAPPIVRSKSIGC